MMRNHLCWEPGAVRQVINPFAEHIPDSLFRAVHSDWALQVTSPVGERYQDIDAAAWTKMEPAEFLADFLREDRPHALVAILGETGSGKSHLVHWMRLNLREDPRRMVLIVRKSGTSLRAIVRDIIGKLPLDQQRSFLDTFNAAGDGTMTPEGRRRELLHHLGQAIREDTPATNTDELEEALIDALASGRDVASVADDLLSETHIDDVFRDVMNGYFGALPLTLQDDTDEDCEDDGRETEDDQAESPASQTLHAAPRLQKALELHLARPEVRDGLRAIVQEVLSPDVADFDSWLRRLVLETLGEAMLQACVASAPRQATLDNLLVDIRQASEGRPASVWITETTLGGAGVLESFADRFAGEPNSFFNAVEAALAPTDFELVDSGLRRILNLACTDQDIRNGMARLRATESHSESAEIWRELSSTLSKHGGVDLSHALVVALNSRLLRPGAGPALDGLLADLTAHWDSLENRLGMALGLREFAYAVSSEKVWADRVHSYMAGNLPSDAAANVSVFAAVFGMLWSRESEVRRTTLSAYNPYRSARTTDPVVVRELLLRRTIRMVDLSAPNWKEALYAAFAEEGACRLRASTTQSRELRAALVLLGATPADVGVLQFFPVVERIQRGEDCILVDLLLREYA